MAQGERNGEGRRGHKAVPCRAGVMEEVFERSRWSENDLIEFIVDAQETTVDFTSVPFALDEFYSLLGFPEYLSHARRERRPLGGG